MIDRVDSPTEKRRAVRHRVLKGAKIFFNSGNSTISCLVRDQSDAGARLKVDSTLGIPDTFMLQIMAENLQACRVMWRANRELGVSFH